MKKFYASIFALIAGASVAMAQDEPTSFAFLYNGQVVPNGSVINVAHVETLDLGPVKIHEMHVDLKLKNVSEDASRVTLVCEGKENYDKVQFCPNGNCQAWGQVATLSTDYSAVPAGQIADNADWLHVSSGAVTEPTLTFDGTVVVKAYPPLDDEDCATVTIHFNTAGTDGVQSLTSLTSTQQVEVFNLCGKLVANTTAGLPKGIYIVRQGGTSRKVTVR